MDYPKITVCTGYRTIPEKTLKETRCLVCLFEPDIGYINMLKSQGWGEIRREIYSDKIHDNIHFLTNMYIEDVAGYSFYGPVPTCVFMFTIEDEYYILAGFDFRKIGITEDLNTKKLLMQKHVLHCMKFKDINPHNIFLCGITKDSEFEGTITRGMGFNSAVKSSEFYTGGFFINENGPQAYTSCNVDYPIKPLFVLAHADVCDIMKSLKPSDTSIPSVMMNIHPPKDPSNESSIRELNLQLTKYNNSESLDINKTWAEIEELLESKDNDDIHSGNYARLQYESQRYSEDQTDAAAKVRKRVRSNQQTQRSPPKGTRLDDPQFSKGNHTLRRRIFAHDNLNIIKAHSKEDAKKSEAEAKKESVRAAVLQAKEKSRKADEAKAEAKRIKEAEAKRLEDESKRVAEAKDEAKRLEDEAKRLEDEAETKRVAEAKRLEDESKRVEAKAETKRVAEAKVETANPTQPIGDLIRAQAKQASKKVAFQQENVSEKDLQAAIKEARKATEAEARKATEAEVRKAIEAEVRKAIKAEARTSSKSSKDKPSIIPDVVRNLFLSRNKNRAKNGSKHGGSRKRNKTRKNNLPKKYANLLYRSRRASRIA